MKLIAIILILLLSIIDRHLSTSMNIIRLTVQPENVIIMKDDYSKIKCHINVPNAKYSWVFVNERTNTEQPVVQDQYVSTEKDGVLILKYHNSIAGKYRCRAIVPDVGIVISQIIPVDLADMFVNKLPTTSLGSGYYKIKDRAILTCPFTSVLQSEIEYKWAVKRPEGQKQISSSKTTVFHHNGRVLELEVSSDTFGSYFCSGFYSRFGLERASSDIDVLSMDEKDDKDGSLLKWVALPTHNLHLDNNELQDKYAKMDNDRKTVINKEKTSRLELICAANSQESDTVEVLWFKDKVRIDRVVLRNERFNYEIIGQGTLVLINTSNVYDGLYTCQASLKKNSSLTISNSFNLIVKPQLRFIENPPPIVVKDRNTEILLKCRINDIGSDNKIIWRKNGELMLGNSYIYQNDGYLRISKFLKSDEGIFQCLADNEFSSIQAITQLKIASAIKTGLSPEHLPLSVKNLRVKAGSFGTLNISWNHAIPGFETILHYEIILFDLSNLSLGNPKITLKADRLESSILAKDLVPDSFYKIFVYSVNGSGKSYPAVINSSPRVLSRAPNASPTNIRVSKIGSIGAIITWSPPEASQMNGELIGYRLIIESRDGFYSKSMDVNAAKIKLTDLTAGTKYTVQIQASTRGGRGPLSTHVYFETKDTSNNNDNLFNHDSKFLNEKKDFSRVNDVKRYDKSAESPSQIINWRSKGLNTSIALQWSHPVAGGQVTKYTIKWGKVYPGPNQITVQYPTSAYVIDNLEFRTQYMIKIIPINDFGEGKELLFSTSTGNPDIKKIPIPLNLGINKVGMTWAIITWEDPSNDLSNTRIYQIQYSSVDKDFQVTEFKNSTENKVQITGLRSSTSYSFSVRTGDIIPPRDGDYGNKEWGWSEWSLKESFSTMGEKPSSSPRDLKLVTLGTPDVRNNDVYTRVLLSWSSPNKNTSIRSDEISRYTIYFTMDPKVDLSNWNTQILPSNQFSSEISLNGIQKIYYFRLGCKTKNFECPLSRVLLYKTSDTQKKNYGLLRIPEKYQYTVNIPDTYLKGEPVATLDEEPKDPLTTNKEAWWIMTSSVFGAVTFLVVLIICIFIWHRRRSQSSFTGYKLGTKSSIQHIGGAGLLLSNQSPALSNGKVSPHYVSNFSQSLKTPDLFPHPEPHFGDLESDSNQDNDSLRFASVSQHHLASTSGVTNMFNPTIQNHSLIRSHPQMVSNYYSDMPTHSKSAINASTILNPLINNSISIPIQIQDTSLQRAPHQTPVYSYQGHPFTQHLLSSGAGMPICSSSCLQPIHLTPQMLATPHEVHSPTNFSNTPRVNASELASHTSSEDIRPVMNGSRANENDMYPYYGSAGNSTSKSQKTAASSKSHAETLRNPDVIKSGIDSSQSESEVAKAFSTEELSQEMANLEGLMKDLNAITQKEFEC